MKMRTKPKAALVFFIVFLALSCWFPSASSANYTFVYELLDHPGGSIRYQLSVAVSESLLEYYAEESHTLISDNEFAKFVTPNALKPIADCLREIYPGDEDFANGVLMIVHQIPYEETRFQKYPVETLVANKGDCDLFSFIAASIMKAGGLNVVLFYYESEEHMNVGVSLSQEPNSPRGGIDYELYNGTKYYMAECTGGNLQDGWRVGECPDDLKDVSLQVITLENCEQSAPGQVSASLNGLAISTISLDISSGYLTQGGAIKLSGQLSPPLQNKTITLYIKPNGLPWSELTEVPTNGSGWFMYVWVTDFFGTCCLRASWPGGEGYGSADSAARTVTVLPWSLIVVLAMLVILACVGTAVFLKTRHPCAK
jgi:hypothetical protein